VYRRLSDVLLVSSAKFATESPVGQTAILTRAEGLPILFVPNFTELSNKRRLRERLLAGEDVKMELEFNGLELTDEDRRALDAVRPVLERIVGLATAYPWLPAAVCSGFTFTQTHIRRNDYKLHVTMAKKIWGKASKYWTGGPQPDSHRKDSQWNSKDVYYRSDHITIGCQNIPRVEVEFVARHYGWEPTVFEG
jgi:hypothetical protein